MLTLYSSKISPWMINLSTSLNIVTPWPFRETQINPTEEVWFYKKKWMNMIVGYLSKAWKDLNLFMDSPTHLLYRLISVIHHWQPLTLGWAPTKHPQLTCLLICNVIHQCMYVMIIQINIICHHKFIHQSQHHKRL